MYPGLISNLFRIASAAWVSAYLREGTLLLVRGNDDRYPAELLRLMPISDGAELNAYYAVLNTIFSYPVLNPGITRCTSSWILI